MMKRLFLAPFLCLVTTARLHAQDAAALLEKSRQVTSLEQPSGPSFHLKAELHTFDYKGVPDGDGTVEETFEHGGRWKRTIVYRGQQTVEVFSGTGKPVFERAPEFEASFAESSIIKMLFAPVPAADKMNSMRLSTTPLKMGGLALTCVVASLPSKSETDPKATAAPNEAYCIAPDTGLVRTVQAHNNRISLFNNFVRVNTVFFTKDIAVMERGKPRANLHITEFGASPKIAPDEFTLPNGTADQANTPVVPRSIIAGRILNKPKPIYPQSAKDRRVQGVVVLHALIGKQGNIKDLELVSTPDDELAESAMDAVRKWTYQPYLLDGEPTVVDTQITVNYGFETRP